MSEKENAPGREQTTIRLPLKLKEELMREAYGKGMSFNDYILSLIHRARAYPHL